MPFQQFDNLLLLNLLVYLYLKTHKNDVQYYQDDYFNYEISELNVNYRYHDCGVDSYVFAKIGFKDRVIASITKICSFLAKSFIS